MSRTPTVALVIAALAVSGCVSVPTGPRVAVFPASWKPFDVFRADDAACRQWAQQQLGVEPVAAAQQSVAGSAAIGTILGAGLGAAIGAAAGNPGIGAAIGAGAGLLGGSAVGADAAAVSSWELQGRYDIAYQQCMYANGHQISGVAAWTPRGYVMPPPPPPPGPGPAPPPPPPPPKPGS
jgi:hypothetical protein